MDALAYQTFVPLWVICGWSMGVIVVASFVTLRSHQVFHLVESLWECMVGEESFDNSKAAAHKVGIMWR